MDAKRALQGIIDKFLMPIYDRLVAVTIILSPRRQSHLIAQTLKNRTYVSDGVISSHYSAKWMNDLNFYESSWELVEADYKATHEPLMRHRAYLTRHLVELASRVDGDIVELGVHWGILPINYAMNLRRGLSGRTIWLFDLWGLEEEFARRPDLPTAGGGYMVDNFRLVKQRFSKLKNIKFVRGYVPETLEILVDRQISYLSLDLNSSEPELQALRILWDSISSGGVVFFDDIGGITYTEQRRKVESFLREVGHELMYLPTGQAFLVKR